MTRWPIIAILLTVFWSISGLSGSGWFWVFLMIFPIYIIIIVLNAWKKYDAEDLGLWWISGIFIVLSLGFSIVLGISLWSMIIFLYILASILVLGATFTSHTTRWVFLLPGIIIGIIFTSFIGAFYEKKQINTVTPTPSVTTPTLPWGLK